MSSRSIYPKLAQEPPAADPDEERRRGLDKGAGRAAQTDSRRSWRVWVTEEPAPGRTHVGRLGVHARETPRRHERRPHADAGAADATRAVRRVECRRTSSITRPITPPTALRITLNAVARHRSRAQTASGVVEIPIDSEADDITLIETALRAAVQASNAGAASGTRHARRRLRSCRAIGGGTHLPRAARASGLRRRAVGQIRGVAASNRTRR